MFEWKLYYKYIVFLFYLITENRNQIWLLANSLANSKISALFCCLNKCPFLFISINRNEWIFDNKWIVSINNNKTIGNKFWINDLIDSVNTKTINQYLQP